MNQHNEHSSYREKLIEHLFISELLKLSWLEHECSLEIAKPEVDNSGYDVIGECYGVVRHIQLKASFITSSTSKQNIHMKLADKPSGCVIWIIFDENTLEFKNFLFYGDVAGEPLPGIENLKTARHTKGNKDGIKNERPNIKIINKGQFQSINSVRELFNILFSIDHSEKDNREACIIPRNESSDIENHTVTRSKSFNKMNRIKIWSQKPWQKNYQLIKGFLDLKSTNNTVYFDQLITHCSNVYGETEGIWKNNFNSMKTDYGNSHGKVFYIINNEVNIYDEVKSEIEKYY
ncbi:hypothetical protein [Pseudoalteromonas sp. P1-25]|uniref:hypothetical protein n=1 Tax=Pseudoalteromonas sp. P1-25 TaxID=1723758 RepID=UPI0006E7201B|nr:hypothetical protein [Pseudoalteromonas sp. P1-25]KPZ57957.1 hypothetical protein AN393_00551 [Pseudoalteromonas sp. P1-25]